LYLERQLVDKLEKNKKINFFNRYSADVKIDAIRMKENDGRLAQFLLFKYSTFLN